MAQKTAHPAVRFLVALLIVVAVALIAFYVGYVLGMRLAVAPGVLPGLPPPPPPPPFPLPLLFPLPSPPLILPLPLSSRRFSCSLGEICSVRSRTVHRASSRLTRVSRLPGSGCSRDRGARPGAHISRTARSVEAGRPGGEPRSAGGGTFRVVEPVTGRNSGGVPRAARTTQSPEEDEGASRDHRCRERHDRLEPIPGVHRLLLDARLAVHRLPVLLRRRRRLAGGRVLDLQGRPAAHRRQDRDRRLPCSPASCSVPSAWIVYATSCGRPSTLDERRERELDLQMMEQRLGEEPARCAFCGRPRCATTTSSAQRATGACATAVPVVSPAPRPPTWRVCPYCETDVQTRAVRLR